MFRRLVERWDWFVYRLAFYSLRRMCKRYGGFAYLLELHIREYRKRNPLSPEYERATEAFHEAIQQTVDNMEAARRGSNETQGE